MMYDENNPPPESNEPGDPIWLLVTAEVAADQGYPDYLIGKYVINGRIPFSEENP